ncbi:ABC transporter ATP-binding protein [Cryptosporangium aurantiacum]|uniref:Branched-chain amino acid transport system ATP-binding protein n=1 Tax=Cryptosporangium aurantiacum TaxID=134849 RepID=A0A1M7R2Y8_9ACTN|nr:ABC transporter ATP-binding protein [Cryptosporangium aurantiacum]SHN39396.1 branched-chain amino acid transport system ATP-binding protein [Cryptosporangium aurantiacum]
MNDVLTTTDLTVRYGGNLALDGVSLRIGAGELVGLIGPNGAGKTTFIDALTGFTRSTGRVVLDGTDLTRAKPHQRARRGLGRTWQGAELYDDLTVRDNLDVGAHRPTWSQSFRELLTGRSAPSPAATAAVTLLGLDDVLDTFPEDLSQGQRKTVDVARALAAGSQVLCLDEPAAGLDSDESLELGNRLRSLVDGGTSLLLVDHDMGLVLGVCDRVYVLDLGRLIAEGTPDEIRRSPAVIEAYLGEEVPA